MNAPVHTAESSALATIDRALTGRDLILQPENLNAMVRVSEMMAKSRNMVPKHLRENPGGCLAVTMQAMRWNMDPFALAVKTYTVSPDAPVAYEGQAIIAALNNSPLLTTRLNFEWFGDWHKIVGKFKEVVSKTKKDDDGNFKKYIVPDWNIEHEQGLGVRVWATLAGEKEPRKLELLMTQVRTRNSGLWTEDPKQQISYLSGRRWGRLHAPDVIMGVYTPDELMEPTERFMGMADVLPPAAPPADPVPPTWPADKFAERLPIWKDSIVKGKTVDGVITFALTKGALTDDQIAAIKALPAQIVKEAGERKPEGRTGPAASFAQIAEAMRKAADMDALNEAAILITAVGDKAQSDELNAIYDQCAKALN